MTHLDILLTTPLLVLGIGSLFLLMLGAFSNSARATGIGAALVIVAAMVQPLLQPVSGPVFPIDGGAGGHLMQVSPFTNIATLILLGIALLCLPLIETYFKAAKAYKPEVYVLIVLALAGMVALITSAHLLTLYVALELMSFPIYILAAFLRDDAKSSESGLKYYVLGSMASGLMLYGISLIYAGLGTLSFTGVFTAFNVAVAGGTVAPMLLVGVTLVLVASLFKLSVAPFHMWTPDVYEGAPTPVTAIMGSLPKIAAVALLIRLLAGPFDALEAYWQPALGWLAIASMLVGASLAIVQTNLKRLLAFSTIANVGFIMVGIVAANPQGASGALLYLGIYAFTTLGLFAALMASGAQNVNDLKGLATRNKPLAATFLLLLFSLAGIPPLAGFMAKFGVFMAAVQAGLVPLAIAGVLSSVLALFYSLWLIKVMVFDTPDTLSPTPKAPCGLEVVMYLSVLATLILGLFPTLLGNLTLAAATAIF